MGGLTTLRDVPDISVLPLDAVAQIRDGNLAAFEVVYRAMHAPLVTFAMRYVGDGARAEELVQDLFVELWQRRTAWTVQGSLRSYLFAAARNRALNLRRRDAVERDWADDEAHDAVRALHPAPTRPDVALEQEELQARLARALASLPERCALVMHLRWRDGLSYGEIAEVMGISTKGVENQLGRGLKALREKLSDG